MVIGSQPSAHPVRMGGRAGQDGGPTWTAFLELCAFAHAHMVCARMHSFATSDRAIIEKQACKPKRFVVGATTFPGPLIARALSCALLPLESIHAAHQRKENIPLGIVDAPSNSEELEGRRDREGEGRGEDARSGRLASKDVRADS